MSLTEGVWGELYGVEDLNMVISNIAFVTLLGPSGWGKTTRLRTIAGLETPTSGRITIGTKPEGVICGHGDGLSVVFLGAVW